MFPRAARRARIIFQRTLRAHHGADRGSLRVGLSSSSLRSHERRESVVREAFDPSPRRASITSVPRPPRKAISAPFVCPESSRRLFKRACCREAEGHACGRRHGRGCHLALRVDSDSTSMRLSRLRGRVRRRCEPFSARRCARDAEVLRTTRNQYMFCEARKGACSPSSRGRRRAERGRRADEVDPAVAQSFIVFVTGKEARSSPPALLAEVASSTAAIAGKYDARHVGYGDAKRTDFRTHSSAACSDALGLGRFLARLHLVGFVFL